MKKLSLILMVLVASLSVNAQSIKLYKNGQVSHELDISAVDSIVYCPGDDESLPILGYYGYMDDEALQSATLSSDEKLNLIIENAKTNKIRHNLTEVKGPTNTGTFTPVMLTKDKNAPVIRIWSWMGWTVSADMHSSLSYFDGVETTTIDNETYYIWCQPFELITNENRLEITLGIDY